MRTESIAEAREWLDRYGLLLVVDARLPSVTTIVTGGPVKGSWWGHPQSHEIFAVVERLEGTRDALPTKLLSGKVTFVHRRLWPALAGVGSAGESWQLRGLSSDAHAVLTRVGEVGWVRTDDAQKLAPLDLSLVRSAAKKLERRILIVSREVHTESGAHARMLESWESWATRIGFRDAWRKPSAGKRELEATLKAVNRRFAAHGRLPWEAR